MIRIKQYSVGVPFKYYFTVIKLFTSGDNWQNSEEKHGLKTVFLRYESSSKVLIKNITREHKFRYR
jgi:hypothetical protein